MLRKSFGTISKLFLTIRTKIGQFFVHIKQMKKMYKKFGIVRELSKKGT